MNITLDGADFEHPLTGEQLAAVDELVRTARENAMPTDQNGFYQIAVLIDGEPAVYKFRPMQPIPYDFLYEENGPLMDMLRNLKP
jgi:hypothetical protein